MPLHAPATRLASTALLCVLLGACSAQSTDTDSAAAPAAVPDTTGAEAASASTPTPAPPPMAATASDATAAMPSSPSPADPATASSADTGTSRWTYAQKTVAEGAMPTASITSQSGQERLEFDQHPLTGRHATLHVHAPVDCEAGCKVGISIDGAAPVDTRVTRPFDERQWFQIRDPRELWNQLDGASTLVITYPSAGGPAEVRIDVAGLDTSRLPGWAQ